MLALGVSLHVTLNFLTERTVAHVEIIRKLLEISIIPIRCFGMSIFVFLIMNIDLGADIAQVSADGRIT